MFFAVNEKNGEFSKVYDFGGRGRFLVHKTLSFGGRDKNLVLYEC